MINPVDKEYIKSGRWKCDKSPTGAHWWIENGSNHETFTCKFCHQCRRFGVPKYRPYKPSYKPVKEQEF